MASKEHLCGRLRENNRWYARCFRSILFLKAQISIERSAGPVREISKLVYRLEKDHAEVSEGYLVV